MVGQSKINYQDLEVFWSVETKMPSNEKNDGSCSDNPMPPITITPFGDKNFKSPRVYFGLYSKTGIHLRLGASFGFDFYS